MGKKLSHAKWEEYIIIQGCVATNYSPFKISFWNLYS